MLLSRRTHSNWTRHLAAGLFAAVWLTLFLLPSGSAAAEQNDWTKVVAEARGQTVYFNAWGGDLTINRYVEWAADRLREEYDVELRLVKVTDIAEAVTRVRAERAAGRNNNGSVDLLWINGENFAAMHSAGLLYGPWVSQVPNASLVNWEGNASTLIDGTLATDGFELPWGTAALTFFFDTGQVTAPPTNPAMLQAWIAHHPGRFSYPQPPAFLGTAFLKQMLLLLAHDTERLQQPVSDDFDEVTQPLWTWLDQAHPYMWRKGRLFPLSGPAQRDLLAVGELDWMLSYNPSEASRAIRNGDLHKGVGAVYFDGGALANSHFLAIPYNSSATAGSRVAANFLLSPQAQARKADEQHWGDPTVLALDKLDADDRQAFSALQTGTATPAAAKRYLPEPHSSWATALEHAWLERYVR